MFKLHHLKGDTYYIDSPTNVGVYKLGTRDCILIDTCYAGSITEKLLSTLSYYSLNVKSILHTHAHVDHFGSDPTIQNKYNCTIGAPSAENIFIEQPELTTLLITNASPLSALNSNFPMDASRVDIVYKEDTVTVEDVTITLLDLKGHSINHTGIMTPDDVIFSGDAFLDQKELSQVKMLYNYDIGRAIKSMNFLSDTNHSIYVPSHGKPSSSIKETIWYNLSFLEEKSQQLLKLLKNEPLSMEEILRILILEYGVTEQVRQYYIAQACIFSHISYLENMGLLKIILDGGVIKFIHEK